MDLAAHRQGLERVVAHADGLLADVDRDPWSRANRGGILSETELWSPASRVKACLDTMRLRLSNSSFSRDFLGAAAEAFYGGLAETPFRGAAPVVVTDCASLFPAVAINGGLWRLWIAETIGLEEVTDEVR